MRSGGGCVVGRSDAGRVDTKLLKPRKRPAWTAVPAARSALPVLQIRLFAVLGSLLLAAMLGLFSFFAWVSNDVPPPNLSGAFAQAGAVAEVVAADFLAGRDTIAPVAAGLDASFSLGSAGVSRAALPVRSRSELSWRRVVVLDRLMEYHDYLVTTTAGASFVLTVAMELGPRGAVLAAYPTLQPAVYAASGSTKALDYTEEKSKLDGVPAPVAERVGKFAAAWAANDAAVLRDLTGDAGAQPGEYVGLGGFETAGGPQIVSAVPRGDALVLRVRLVLTAPSANGFSMSNDLDLLVLNPNSTIPLIVAWGPAGTGPTLTPNNNRVTR